MSFYHLFNQNYNKVPTGIERIYISNNKTHIISWLCEEYFTGNKEAGPPYYMLSNHYYSRILRARLLIEKDDPRQYLYLKISCDGIKDYNIPIIYTQRKI